MAVLFTDFGIQDHYVGQLKAALLQSAPELTIIDLLHEVPAFNIRAAAYLLAALVDSFPKETIFLCVVDPGVGSERAGCVARLDDQWFVGPDNGLFAVLQQRARQSQWWQIDPPVSNVAATFHGRDIFASVAAKLANGDQSMLHEIKLPLATVNWPEDLLEIVYIDHYGNLITGYRFSKLPVDAIISVNAQKIEAARTFSDVNVGKAFYYSNSNGLLEIAINQGSAADYFRASIGDEIELKTKSASTEDG